MCNAEICSHWPLIFPVLLAFVAVPARAEPPAGYKLVWSDEFDGKGSMRRSGSIAPGRAAAEHAEAGERFGGRRAAADRSEEGRGRQSALHGRRGDSKRTFKYLYLDGKLTHQTDAQTLPHGEQNVWLTCVAVLWGDPAPPKQMDDSGLPARADFDWVRVYEK